ncbi:hypothetical protein HHI36_001677 [Cryptolaemus montrouzieri]|uniref:Peroxisomal membrane protein PEX13 n=1 Tax=Cryptolaemus montrouzieri TaxID=559131 RepID=A0ABD2P8N4_9CUCU
MTSPAKPWEGNVLQNVPSSFKHTQNPVATGTMLRSAPGLPPRPDGLYRPLSTYSMPYSGYGGYGGYGGLNSYGGLGSYSGLSSYSSYGMPYSSSYGGFNGMGMYHGGYSNLNDDAERRFIQYAEESSRKTFANVESIVRAFGSVAVMLDNTFFAMTSSFRAVLSVAENFGRLRSTFGQIWYSVSIFRLFTWLYRKIMELMGYKVKSSTSIAWNQAIGGATSGAPNIPDSSGSSWPAVALLGVLISAPYIISKFLLKYEDKADMSHWKSPGIAAKAAFDFTASNPQEMSIVTNDEVILAPTYIQESMKLKNSGWVYALSNGKSGIIPLNYLVLNKSSRRPVPFEGNMNQKIPPLGNFELTNQSSTNEKIPDYTTVPVLKNNDTNGSTTVDTKTHVKKVSFGENQIFENIDLDDVIKKAEHEAKQYKNKTENCYTESNSDFIDEKGKKSVS